MNHPFAALILSVALFASASACGDGVVASASDPGPDPIPAPTPVIVDQALRATVDSGELEGTERDGASAFLGVPYAAPPLGSLRWKVPQPVAAWDDVRAADTWGSACPQNVSYRPGWDPNTPVVGTSAPMRPAASRRTKLSRS